MWRGLAYTALQIISAGTCLDCSALALTMRACVRGKPPNNWTVECLSKHPTNKRARIVSLLYIADPRALFAVACSSTAMAAATGELETVSQSSDAEPQDGDVNWWDAPGDQTMKEGDEDRVYYVASVCAARDAGCRPCPAATWKKHRMWCYDSEEDLRQRMRWHCMKCSTHEDFRELSQEEQDLSIATFATEQMWESSDERLKQKKKLAAPRRPTKRVNQQQEAMDKATKQLKMAADNLEHIKKGFVAATKAAASSSAKAAASSSASASAAAAPSSVVRAPGGTEPKCASMAAHMLETYGTAAPAALLAPTAILAEGDFDASERGVWLSLSKAQALTETIERSSAALGSCCASMLATSRSLHSQNAILSATYVQMKRQIAEATSGSVVQEVVFNQE